MSNACLGFHAGFNAAMRHSQVDAWQHRPASFDLRQKWPSREAATTGLEEDDDAWR
jgi:hypothetical protein